MKFLFLIGSGAVGKMTVGQELSKITDLRLFHNHMTIEPVIEIFGYFDGKTSNELREVIFKNFAASGQYGMIFTYIWAFDEQSDWDYIDHIKKIFEPYDTEFYCVELVASEETRLARNRTENRLKNKASKRNLEWSEANEKKQNAEYRTVSRENEIPFQNYLRINNENLSPEETARFIKDSFNL